MPLAMSTLPGTALPQLLTSTYKPGTFDYLALTCPECVLLPITFLLEGGRSV
jgi:hypothetical protein